MSKQPKGTEKALRVQQCARWERLFSDIANRAKKNASECQVTDYIFHSNVHDVSDTFNKSMTPVEVQLKSLVEDNLNSKVKHYVLQRSKSRILEDGKFEYWHKKTKKSIKALTPYLSKHDIQYYIYLFSQNYNKRKIVRFIELYIKSKLKNLLKLRESLRDDPKKLTEIQLKIITEWDVLTTYVSLEHVVFYAMDIVTQLKNID
ncbi:uncharacterized protein LOC114342180 isoform X1 [Diabrotica virgifera virgifera]|uniref:Uncharacterized protein LOC114342180 n=1 Tax=Diabrotica virgifera virgifera TaxID=50390 RepID=A0A6P7GYB4_DIAVI|nr:uncharacterized protein LOC114342180 isoform X1 [Diabrotica virgifera virgifera]